MAFIKYLVIPFMDFIKFSRNFYCQFNVQHKFNCKQIYISTNYIFENLTGLKK